jgi:hemolysin D
MLKLLTPPIKTLTKRARDIRRTLDSHGLLTISRPGVLPEAIPYQDPIDEVCEEAPPRHMRSTTYAVAGMFLSLLLLAALVKIPIIVSGAGRIATDTPLVVLQPMDRAIIREMKVRPGDVVKKGQLLATLDPTFAGADLAALSSEQRMLVAQIRRLEAELSGVPYEPKNVLNAEDQLQGSLYSQRQSQYAAQLRVFDEEIRRRNANIRTTENQRDAQAKQLVIAKDVEGMRSQMFDKQVGSRLTFLQAQSTRMSIEQEIEGASNRLVEQRHDLQSKQAERQAFVDQWRQQIMETLVSARTAADRIGGGVMKAELLNEMVAVTAPDDGVVLEIAKRSVGSIVRETEPVVTIVPTNAALIAEVMLNSSDVGYASPGDKVVVKVDTFNYNRHGTLEGKLLTISEESYSASGLSASTAPLPRDGSGAYHKALVQLVSTELENLPEGAHLIPGMTMIAEINVGSRTVLGYFLNPLTRGLQESMREP